MRTHLACALVLCVALVACGGGNPMEGTDAGRTPGMDSGLPPTDSGVTGCATTGPEDTLAACSDSCDNEPDGFADCDDFGCCDLRTDCPATSACGMRMPRDAGPPAMQCPGPVMPENTVEACTDGCSNDDDSGDGGVMRIFVDCNDVDCCGVVTCAPGTFCGDRMPRDAGPATTACDGAMVAEDTLALCSDGCSNDGDAFADCNDFDCCSVRTDCPATTSCGRPRTDAGPITGLCPGPEMPENTIAACMDGCSNDGDRFIDCDDFDCCPRDGSVRTDCPATSSCGRRM